MCISNPQSKPQGHTPRASDGHKHRTPVLGRRVTITLNTDKTTQYSQVLPHALATAHGHTITHPEAKALHTCTYKAARGSNHTRAHTRSTVLSHQQSQARRLRCTR